MAFRRVTGQLQFQPPQIDQNLIGSRPDITSSIDSIFNNYLRMKQMQNEEQDRRGAALLQYGFDPRQVTPETITQASGDPAAGLLATPAPLPQWQMDMMAPQWPKAFAQGLATEPVDQVAQPEPDIVRHVRDFISKRDLSQRMKTRESEAEIGLNTASSRLKDAEARYYEGGGSPRASGVNRPPPGYRFLPNGDLEVIPGGPAATKIETSDEKADLLAKSSIEQADRVIAKVDQALKNVSAFSTGIGSALKSIPGTSAHNLEADIKTIQANLGFAELSAMRKASPTGGALGAISDREIGLLTSTIASLDQSQSEEQTRRNLAEVRAHYSNWRDAVQEHRKQLSSGVTPKINKPISLTGSKAARLAELRAKANR